MENYLSYDLLDAVRDGDVDKASELIAICGLSSLPISSGDYFLLCEALKRNHTKIAKILLEHGSTVNSKEEHQTDTPLHFAVKNKDAEIVAMLLNREANVNARNNWGQTPLHLSIKKNNLKIVSLLLNKNADVNAKNNYGETPLYRAIVEVNVEIVELIWRNDARAHAGCSKEIDALHIAAEIGITKIVDHLLNSGAFIDIACDENGYTPLHCAVVKSREEIVKLLLKRGADVNARTKKQSTALHLAIEMKFDRIVKVLLEHEGVDFDAENDGGKTVLNVAIERGHRQTVKTILVICPQVNNERNRHCIRDYLCGLGKERSCRLPIVKMLLSYNFGVHPEDASNHKLLHIAVEEGYTKIVEDLLRYGADVDALHMQKKGYTLLHNAAFNKRLDIAEMLIKHGADVNAIDKNGKTPTSYAIEMIDAKMTKLLVSRGAKIKFDPDVLCNVRVDRNVKEIIKIMLNHDVDLDIKAEGTYGQTALCNVIEFAGPPYHKEGESYRDNEQYLAKLLLTRGAKVNVENRYGKSLLNMAIIGERDDLVEILLRYNADVNFASKIDMKTPLHCSAAIENEQISRMLLNAGAAINVEDKTGQTPLHCSAVFGNEQISRMLLNAGAVTNAKDKTGQTALHYASENNCKSTKKVVDTLLEFGAEIDNKDSKDITPLHVAASYGCQEIVETLLKSFANVECTDEDGKTALHFASNHGWPKIVKELLDYGADPNVTCKKGYSSIDYANLGSRTPEVFYSYPDNRGDCDDIFDEIASIIKKHISKLKSLNIHGNKRNLESVELNDELADFKAECERVVALMKSERIAETNISYYDILMKSMNQLAILARNKDIVKVLESSTCGEQFPIYDKILYYKFKKGQRRENLLNRSLKSFNFLTRFPLPPLPELALLKVLDVLSNKELESLIKAGPETECR